MKHFQITVNGTPYDVQVEEITADGAPAPKAAAPVAAPAAPKAAPSGGTAVCAPMPGNVLDVRVAVGDTVKTGDILIMLEAMKMENEILAPCAGKVTAVPAAKGQMVDTGAVLVRIGE
ncbi:MAG: biotin/lipoyl-binding protein [Clostridia bacterium]|nr:biotin/lipoyl-binding protein [Clostridia bacterium]